LRPVDRNDSDHWLVRPRTIRGLCWAGTGILLLTILAQLLVPAKGYFGIDGWLAFGAIFGFVSCVIMVLGAKALGFLVKRDEDYYQSDPEQEHIDD
jgi:hypothetical protein